MMRQVMLDGSLALLDCTHRARRGREAALLLPSGLIGDVQACRCGHVRFAVRTLRGERAWSDWRAAADHPELPRVLPPLLSHSTKP